MLMTHRDSHPVTLAQLDALPPPVARGPVHRPVPHSELVRAVTAVANARGYKVTRAELALGRRGARLFGTMDLVAPSLADRHEDRTLAIGFRNSTDESLAITMVAGVKVFVCDNLALSGDLIALQRRNTSRLELESELHDAFERFLTHAALLDGQIGALETTAITDLQAKAKIFDLFVARVLPVRFVYEVSECYFHPASWMTDCEPRTLWGLHNSCTRVLKRLPPARAFAANVALGQAFGLSGQVLH